MKHYLGLCLILVTFTAVILTVMWSCTAVADRTINHVRDAFAQVFQVQPQITVNRRVVLTQTAPIAELAIVTKEEMVTLGMTEHLEILSRAIPLTEKTLTAQAVYRIKAGFDLRQPFSVEIDARTNQIHATLPPAKILSVEQVGDLTFQGEDAWLNRVTDDERTKLLNDLHSAAEAQAESSGLKEDAEKQVQARLEEIFKHNGEQMEMNWSSPPIAPILPQGQK
jgi:hypothetical protein